MTKSANRFFRQSFTLVLLAFFCTGCVGLRHVNRVSSVNLHYSDFKSHQKTIRFTEMCDVGKKRFFENVSKLTELSKNDGYVLFYEHLDFKNTPDTIAMKVRRMYSILPDSLGYSWIIKLGRNNGFIFGSDSYFLNKGIGMDTTIDISPTELVTAYEQKFGEIRLLKKDFRIPLDRPLLRPASVRKSDVIFIDYRNKLLAESVQQSPYEKIMVLYGARHRKGFLRELKQLDSTYVSLGRKSTIKDDRFDHSLPPDTMHYYRQNGWIERMSRYIGLKFSFDNDIESFLVDTDDLDFKIKPNTSARVKLGVNYRFLSAALAIAPDFIPGNDDFAEKGETKSFSFGLNFAIQQWYSGFAYHKTRGYYIENTGDLDPTWKPGDPYFQVPDLVYQAYDCVTGYSFNPKFSVSAITSQTERQVKSAGTFTSRIHFRYYSIDDQKELQTGASSQKSDNIEFIGSAGYHYIYVIKSKWHINGGIECGPGYMHSLLTTRGAQSGSTTQDNLIVRWDARAGIGYNDSRLFAGGFATGTGSSFRQENTTAINTETRIFYQIYVGYRFSAPKFIRERIE